MSQVASPFSTGSGGASFETRVHASFIATMLVNGAYPCLPPGIAESIKLQARREGYATDDLVLSVKTPAGSSHRLLVQIKHDIAISATNEAFRDAITGAWRDFNNEEHFDPSADRIAVISGPVSANAIRHAFPILAWARSSQNGEEFVEKVSTPGFSSLTRAPKSSCKAAISPSLCT